MGKTEPQRDQSAPSRFADWLAIKISEKRTVDGLLVVGDKGTDRVAEALQLIRVFDPIRHRRLLADVKRIWITALPGSIAQFRNSTFTCEIEERFVLDERTAPELIASTIVHEATHARLFRMGIGYEEEQRGRVEQVCLRRELAFSAKLPAEAKAGQRAEATLNALPDFSDGAMAERRYAGAQNALVYLGLTRWIADAIVSFSRWRRARMLKAAKSSAGDEKFADRGRAIDDS